MRLWISIAGLMVLVVASALASALAIFTIRLEPMPIQVLTVVLLTLGFVIALFRRGRFAPVWLTYSIAGWSYFIPSWIKPTLEPTTRWLAHVYELIIGSPKMFTPDDVLPFVRQLTNFLQVGHAILALLFGIAAGLTCLAILGVFSLWRPRSTALPFGESPLPPQAASRLLESSNPTT